MNEEEYNSDKDLAKCLKFENWEKESVEDLARAGRLAGIEKWAAKVTSNSALGHAEMIHSDRRRAFEERLATELVKLNH